MTTQNLKYKAEIDTLIRQGERLPELTSPKAQEAYRFVFAGLPERNHLPVCVSNPRRILPPGIKTSGFALSCFVEEEKAEQRYNALSKTFKLISRSIGDSIAEGVLEESDGLMTEPETVTSHFDLYEFTSFDASKTFKLKRSLI